MKTFWLIAIIVLLGAMTTMARADVGQPLPEVPEMAQPVQVVVTNATAQMPVQHVARPRILTNAENLAIADYLAGHRKYLSTENYENLCVAIPFLVAIGQSHTPLTRRPKEYQSDYQIITQVTGKIDWYVNIPAFAPIAGTSPLVAPEFCLDAPVAPICSSPPVVGAYRFGSNADRQETTVGSVSGNWGKWHSSWKEKQETCPEEGPGPGGGPYLPPDPGNVP